MQINTLLSAAAGGSGGTGSTSGSAASDAAGLSNNFDQFLTLLTTQLKYQDPLNPLKSNEFISQLVQFSQVEQSIKSNKNLESLMSLQSANQAVGTLGYIGRTIEATGSDVPLVNGNAQFAYTLADQSAATAIAILDSSGKAVFTTTGETGAGRHEFTWDGKDANGNTLPDGTYHIIVKAADASNNPVDLSTTVFGKVDGVTAGSSGIMLSLGPVEVPADSIVSVKDATTTGVSG